MEREIHSPTSEKPADATSTINWVGIIFFIVLTFGISWTIWLALAALGVPFGIRASIGMFGPAIACVLVRLFGHEGFSDAGLHPSPPGVRSMGRLYLAAYCVPLALLVLGLALSLLLGIQHWILPDYLQATHTSSALFGVICLNDLTLGVITTMPFTFGEELGWRGYLLPRFSPLGGVTAAMLVGVIWGLWHAPLIFLVGYEYGDPHALRAVLMFVLPSITLSIILAWLRFRSGSIWPGVLAHAVGNQAAGLALLALVTLGNLYLGAPIGLVSILLSAAFAIWLIATGRLKPESSRAVEMKNVHIS
jgi:membrane protease YdiL (CAAX protease family)